MEKIIFLEEIDPIDIYGVNNRLFDLLASHYPKIKAIARGAEIYLMGPQSELDDFEEKIKRLRRKRMTKSVLTEYDVESLFEGSDRSAESGAVPTYTWCSRRRMLEANYTVIPILDWIGRRDAWSDKSDYDKMLREWTALQTKFNL